MKTKTDKNQKLLKNQSLKNRPQKNVDKINITLSLLSRQPYNAPVGRVIQLFNFQPKRIVRVLRFLSQLIQYKQLLPLCLY